MSTREGKRTMLQNKEIQILDQGIVCRVEGHPFSFFGWPTIARQTDGTLAVVCSGLRYAHVCPWGKTVLMSSQDDGKTWTKPCVIHDSPIDDRDAGIIPLPGGRWLIS